jgi:hypothetical protein
MKYDFEIPVHDVLGRQQGMIISISFFDKSIKYCLVTKADSMRKIIEHIDGRNWRTLDYFRILENKRKVQLQNQASSQHILV